MFNKMCFIIPSNRNNDLAFDEFADQIDKMLFVYQNPIIELQKNINTTQ